MGAGTADGPGSGLMFHFTCGIMARVKGKVHTLRTVALAHRIWARAGDGILAGAMFVASLGLYLQTLAPSVATLFDDSLEFPLVSHRLAIVHPTGYPLYTLLSKLFTLGAGEGIARRVNLLSAVAAALTVALTFLVVRQLTRRQLPAVLGSLSLAVSPIFWSQAVIAEVYTLHTAFVCAILWLALLWGRRPLAPIVRDRPSLGASASGVAHPPTGREDNHQAGSHPDQAARSKSLDLPSDTSGLLQGERSDHGRRLTPRGRMGEMIGAAKRGLARSLTALRRHSRRIRRGYRRLFPPVPANRRLRPHRTLYVLAASCGLSLTHHRTVLLLAPALLVFVLLVERRTLSRAALLGPEHPSRARVLQIAGRPIVLLALALLGPLLLYLYLPLRGHVGSLDGTYQNTWTGFWRWVTASGYGAFLGANPLARDLDAGFYVQLLRQQFGLVGLALVLVGLVSLFRRPRTLALTGLTFVAFVAFGISYRVPDTEVFFLPAFLIMAIWIGVGLDHAADLLRPRGRSLALRRLLAICGSLLFLATSAQPWVIGASNYADVDLSQRWIVHDFGSYLLEQPLPSNSTVVGLLGEMTLLRYLQETAASSTHVETIAADDEVARREAADRALSEGRAVYLTRSLPGIDADYSLGAVVGVIDVAGHFETLVQVGEPERQLPELPRATDFELVPGLQLLGYGLLEHRGHWQAWARLRLWWRAPEGLGESFKISARLLDAQGQQVSAADAEPVGGIYPTTSWRSGEVVRDAYEIQLPSGLPPGEYRPLLIVYEPDSGTERGRVELEPVHLLGNPTRPPRRDLEASLEHMLYARLGEVELLGFNPPDPKVAHDPGDLVPLTLLWQAKGEPVGDLQLTFWLDGAGKHALGVVPAGGSYPTSQWQDNQVVRQWPSLLVPADTPGGTYQLRMRVTRDGQPLPWGRYLIPLGTDLDLGVVRVSN